MAAGLGSHASLAESLANGTVPAKTMAAGLGSRMSRAESVVNGTVPAKANNFTQLQQHIDDLTKEKFELVRGLKEQQKMAAGLSEENLLLTEDFNRQVICRPGGRPRSDNPFRPLADIEQQQLFCQQGETLCAYEAGGRDEAFLIWSHGFGTWSHGPDHV